MFTKTEPNEVATVVQNMTVGIYPSDNKLVIPYTKINDQLMGYLNNILFSPTLPSDFQFVFDFCNAKDYYSSNFFSQLHAIENLLTPISLLKAIPTSFDVRIINCIINKSDSLWLDRTNQLISDVKQKQINSLCVAASIELETLDFLPQLVPLVSSYLIPLEVYKPNTTLESVLAFQTQLKYEEEQANNQSGFGRLGFYYSPVHKKKPSKEVLGKLLLQTLNIKFNDYFVRAHPWFCDSEATPYVSLKFRNHASAKRIKNFITREVKAAFELNSDADLLIEGENAIKFIELYGQMNPDSFYDDHKKYSTFKKRLFSGCSIS